METWTDLAETNCSDTDMSQFYESDTNDDNQIVPSDIIDVSKVINAFPDEYLYYWFTDNVLRINIYFTDDMNIIQVSNTIYIFILFCHLLECYLFRNERQRKII